MKNKQITYFLIFIGLLIIIIIAANYINSKPNKSKSNPYEYKYDEFKKVNPELISHKEVRQIKIDIGDKGGIAAANNQIYLAAEKSVKILTPEGSLVSEFPLNDIPNCISVKGEKITVGFQKSFTIYNQEGTVILNSPEISDSTIITCLAIWDNEIVIADAGKRKVYIYNGNEETSAIEGVSGVENTHGFIIPSAKFDLAINNENELWVVNPGIHSLQHYDERGSLINSWRKTSLNIEGFCGCCNPSHFSFLQDGSFVTSEKAMPRIKIYDKKGEFKSVVAAPDKFEENGRPSDIAVLNDLIIALDYDKKLIRIFEKK
ncbi:MAG: hypothetical protein KA807_17070 [Prolixibacteraceae bacterium]|nr:hypothetical protein [Prolixibacteraceae bacterium]